MKHLLTIFALLAATLSAHASWPYLNVTANNTNWVSADPNQFNCYGSETTYTATSAVIIQYTENSSNSYGASSSTPHTVSVAAGATFKEFTHDWTENDGNDDYTYHEDITIESVTLNAATTYTLTVHAGTGGTATGSATGLTAGASSSISATPDAGYTFRGWGITGGSVASSTSATTTATISANATAVAVFESMGWNGIGDDTEVPGQRWIDRADSTSLVGITPTVNGIYHARVRVNMPGGFDAGLGNDSLGQAGPEAGSARKSLAAQTVTMSNIGNAVAP